MAANKKYKDSLFSLIFNNSEALRELYGAIEGPLAPNAVITVNTLSDVLYMEQYNDISFTVDNKLVILIEHQSTINPNMPLRLLLYIARVYEKIVERKDLYREKLLVIPRPEFIVLYNGVKPYPEQKTLRLSDAFAVKGGAAALDLEAKVFNINEGHNEPIVGKSENLKGYRIFVDKIRDGRKTMPLDKAMKAAIEYCLERKILVKILKENSSEVINMLLAEWNIDEAKEVWREEALEEGLEKGREETREEIAKRALGEGFPVEMIQKITGLDTVTITGLSAK
ncbi:MAG: Rpn family recombination-promoting nuclease/putative transposase [Treponema sp.]|nr:Rpn family recombination-promoting nuclease/putative transposase [Treponema sp.]